MSKELLSDANEKLNDIFVKNTFDEVTYAALLYLTANKDKLKYLLLPYRVKSRFDILVAHIETTFPDVNINMIKPYIKQIGVFEEHDYDLILLILAIILTLSIDLLIYINVFPNNDIFPTFLWTLIPGLFVCAFIFGVTSDMINRSYCRLYFLSKEFKKLPRPEKSL